MRRVALLALASAVVAARVLGLFTVGAVQTESMEPTMPPGTVFVALPGEARVGDVVVFTAPDGARVVHRVVDRTDEGLVTRGDANEATDQAGGLPPVDPESVHVVPEVAGAPLALHARWIGPAAVAVAQVALLTFGLRAVARSKSGGDRRLHRLRPHHLVLLAAAALVLAAPLLHERADAYGTVAVQAAFLPTVARVAHADGVEVVRVPALSSTVVEARGTVDVVRAPALPGAAALLAFGSTVAMLPAAGLLAGGGLALRARGW